MKKRLSSCLECGDDTSILTQVSGSPEAVLLCTDCYHLKYSHEGQNEIDYTEEEKVKKIVLENLYTGYEPEIYRYPVEEYNRDIIMYLDMFGYKFKKS